MNSPRRAALSAVLVSAALAIAAGAPAGALAGTPTFSVKAPSYAPPAFQPGVSVVTGDYNHDGRADVAFANAQGADSSTASCPLEGCVSVLVGKGDGTFVSSPAPGEEALFPNSPVNYPAGGYVSESTAALAEGELTANGNTDLVAAVDQGHAQVPTTSPSGAGCPPEGCVAILYGNGDANGTFQEVEDVRPAGMQGTPVAVAVGDFMGEGKVDIAVVTLKNTEGFDHGTVYIMVPDGINEASHVKWLIPDMTPATLQGDIHSVPGMTVAQMIHHGRIDLVVSTTPEFGGSESETCSKTTCVQVVLNKGGEEGLNDAVGYEVKGFGQLAAAELRPGTGYDDVLVPAGEREFGGPSGETWFWAMLNTGSEGELETPVPYKHEGAAYPGAVVVGDFTGNGILDAAVADGGAAPPLALGRTPALAGQGPSGRVAIFEGLGNGTFGYASTANDPEGLEGGNSALAVAELNGDCKPDLVVTGTSQTVSAGVVGAGRPAIAA
ncbi:MAG: VCBS repeat-containing protein, partial [Acidobacteriota bacterium]|nr:VCBS repeat-containing protein [Acidobacteriota bacterium]